MKGFVWVCFLASLFLTACSDAKAVNAAFAQTQVSWFVFDPEQAAGLRPLSGFEQAQQVSWRPRNRAVFATDLAKAPGKSGAAAVTGLGLVLLDDADGTLRAQRPESVLSLSGYRTDRLFTWKDKLFVTLAQETPNLAPAALAWWMPGQNRLALYPVPSQVRDSSRQVSAVVPPLPDSDLVFFLWRQKSADGWTFESGTFNLSNGEEGFAEAPPVPGVSLDGFDAVRARLSERVGTSVAAQPVRGGGNVILFTSTGLVAVGREGEAGARLYRLPDLGMAGRYTMGLALDRGFVFTWETAFRGYAGAAGLVHVPFAVIAP